MHPSQISDWESLTQLVSSASPAQTGGQITRVLLEDFGLKHKIDETREAERYKFGDGGTLRLFDQSDSSHFCCWHVDDKTRM